MSLPRSCILMLLGLVVGLAAVEPVADVSVTPTKERRDVSLQPGWHAILGLDPLSVLVSADLGEMEISSDVGRRLTAAFFPPLGWDSQDEGTARTAIYNFALGAGSYLDPTIEKYEFETYTSTIVGLRAGVAYAGERIACEFTAGPGLLANDQFVMGLIRVDSVLRFRCGRYFAVGPHAAWLYLSDAAEGDDVNAEIAGGHAGMVGVRAALTTKRVVIDLGLDWWFDEGMQVTGHDGYTANLGRLHLDGLFASLGVKLVL